MSLGHYLVGVALFGLNLGAAFICGATFVRSRRAHLRGAERVLAHGVLVTAALLASYLLPGAVGVLNRWSPVVAAVLLAAASRAIPVKPEATDRKRLPSPTVGRAERGVAGLAILFAGGAAAAYLSANAATPVTQVDQVTFHLPVVARWIQTGSLWGVHHFVPYYGVGNYPHTGDLLSLTVISPWRHDAFSRFVELPYYALAAGAVYVLARRLGAPWAPSVTFAALFVSIPMVIFPSLVYAAPDALLFAMVAAGAVFLVREDYVVAGVALGLAFGAKWYGVPAAAALAGVWLIALATRAPQRAVLRAATVLGACALATGGFWLLRNAIGSGTPFAPAGWIPVGVDAGNDFARSIGRGPIDFTVAHYATDLDVWRTHLLPALYSAFRWPGILLLAGAVGAGLATGVEALRGRAHHGPLVALVALMVLAVLYANTPGSAQGLEGAPSLAFPNARYLVPAAIPAAALAAWLSGRLGRWALLVQAAALAAILDGAHRALGFGWARFAVAVAVLAAIGAIGYAARRAPRGALAVGAVTALLAAVVGGRLIQERHDEHRAAETEPALAWILENAPRGARIGVTGAWSSAGPRPVYAAFGRDLRNTVVYVGVQRGRQLERLRSREAFAAALDEKRIDLLLVGRGEPPRARVVEQDWARAAGYVPVSASRWLELYSRAPPVSR